MSISIWNCVTSKFTDMSYALDGSFYPCIISHLENIGSLSNVDLPILAHFIIKYFLKCIHSYHHQAQKKTEYWEAIKLMMIDINFPNF